METRSDLKENRSLALEPLGEFSVARGFRRGFILSVLPCGCKNSKLYIDMKMNPYCIVLYCIVLFFSRKSKRYANLT